jgi:hypothetical protein
MPENVEGEVKRVKPRGRGKTGETRKDPNMAQGERSRNALYEQDAEQKRKQRESKELPHIPDDRPVD